MSAIETNDESERRAPVVTVQNYWSIFWLVTWLGTIVAGGVFGFLAGGGAGLLIGSILAGSYGAPVILTFAVLTWVCWLSRISIALAAFAGACTGIISTALSWDPVFNFGLASSLWFAGFIGAFGGGGFTGLYQARYESSRPKSRDWHYSLRDLFLRFTILVALIAIWTCLAKAHLAIHERASSRAVSNSVKSDSD